MCYLNSFLAAEMLGGEPVLGFMIWATKNLFLTSEHHCIVRTPAGELIDPTPEIMSNSKQVLFVPSGEEATEDNIKQIVMHGVIGHFKALVDHPLIYQALKTLENASKRKHQAQIQANLNGKHLSEIEWMHWDQAVGRMEWLIDRYYQQQQQKMEEKGKRRKAKKQRQARKKARARA
jgi:hypothetical protein